VKNPFLSHDQLELIQARCDAAVTVPGKDDVTRQELTPETDLNQLLKRYMPWELPAKEAFYGERDYTLDHHDAVQANRAAWDRWTAAPKEVRDRFPTFGAFLNSYEAVQEEIRAAEAEPAGSSAGAAGGGATAEGGTGVEKPEGEKA